jgi:hypothetical protein
VSLLAPRHADCSRRVYETTPINRRLVSIVANRASEKVKARHALTVDDCQLPFIASKLSVFQLLLIDVKFVRVTMAGNEHVVRARPLGRSF